MDKPAKTVLICILAVFFNFVSVFLFFDLIHLPLFMDTIFTIAVVFYCGLIPGLLVQISYNILNGFVWYLKTGTFDFFIMLYVICGILIVISTWIIARHKNNFSEGLFISFVYLVVIATVSSFCSVIAGGTIDYFHYKCFNITDVVSPIKKFADGFMRQNFGLYFSCIVAQIPVSFTDRLITTFAGFGVYRLMQRTLGREEK